VVEKMALGSRLLALGSGLLALGSGLSALAGLSVLFGATIAVAETTLPCRQPQLAATGATVYVACGTPTSILVARSEDGGRTFGVATAAATVARLSLGNHRGPRIVALGDTLVLSAIVGEAGGGSRHTSQGHQPAQDGDLLAWRSVDRGKTWSAPVKVSDVATSAREGLHAMAAYGDTVAAAWLDLREKGTTLVVAVSADGGAHWGPNVIAYRSPSGTICQCCHPSLVVDATGRISAMFRNEREGARDMYLIASTDGGRTWTGGEKAGQGTWPLKSCPMDGGAIGLDAQRRLVTTWRRDQTVYLAGPGATETVVGTGVNPTLAITPDGPLVAWNGSEGLMVKRGDAAAALADAQGKFAALIATPGGVVLAYERGAEAVVRRN
jgi:hypothetical protein